jgi:hypothetical protein
MTNGPCDCGYEELIPEMTDPLGKHWDQPDKENILIDSTHALMTEGNFKNLHEYSRSQPSGVYPGKMWKAGNQKGDWWLRWYGIHEDPKLCTNNSREIIIV